MVEHQKSIAPGDQMEICEDTHEFSPDRIVVLLKLFQMILQDSQSLLLDPLGLLSFFL